MQNQAYYFRNTKPWKITKLIHINPWANLSTGKILLEPGVYILVVNDNNSHLEFVIIDIFIGEVRNR
jgi:hypothetical protein